MDSDHPVAQTRTRRVKPWHTRIVRDTAEVVAIVLAGAWALYVFAYQNVIVPAMAPPTPIITVTMRHVGNDGPLAVVQIDENFKNAGTVPVVFSAWATTVFGMSVVPTTHPRTGSGTAIDNSLEAFYRFSHAVPVYRDAKISDRGSDHSPYGLRLNPGQEQTMSAEFFVPRARFPFLQAQIVDVYTSNTQRVVPTTLTIDPSGLARPHAAPSADVITSNVLAAELDLNAQ